MLDLEGKKQETKRRKPEHSFSHCYTRVLKGPSHRSLGDGGGSGRVGAGRGGAGRSFPKTLSGGVTEVSVVSLIGQHRTPHVTAKNELSKTCVLSGFEGGKGSRWHERGNEEKEERKEMEKK